MKNKINTIKIAILIAFTICAVVVFSFNNSLQESTQASSGGLGGGATGAPGETDCTDCHTPITSTGTFTITPPPSYVPGQTYAVQVQHVTTDMTRLRWGFEMTALTTGNAAAGVFTDTTTFTNSFSFSGRNYVDQTSAGSFDNTTGGATWNFNWTAPATDVGPITFYAAGVQANSSNGNSQDQVYTASQQIMSMPTAAEGTLSGRARTTSGRGLKFVVVMLAGGSLQEPIYATTNHFGFYQFEDLPVGETYVLQAMSGRYIFQNPSQVVDLQDNIFNADFIAEPSGSKETTKSGDVFGEQKTVKKPLEKEQ